ncbi:MAG: hypothetical protein AAFQ65_13180 [Myxococcota bacterium]
MRAAGVDTMITVGPQGALAGVSLGAVCVISQAPMETRGRKVHASGENPAPFKPREKLIEWPKKKLRKRHLEADRKR